MPLWHSSERGRVGPRNTRPSSTSHSEQRTVDEQGKNPLHLPRRGHPDVENGIELLNQADMRVSAGFWMDGLRLDRCTPDVDD